MFVKSVILIICLLFFYFVSPTICVEYSVQCSPKILNVMSYGACGNGICDDSEAILRAWEDVCGAEEPATLVIPPMRIFLVTQLQLNGPCKSPKVFIWFGFGAKIVAPTMDRWVDDKANWIMISYINGLTILGNGGINIDGYGSTWWETCKSCTRPAALGFHACNDLLVSYLNLVNSPRAHITVDGCNHATFNFININAPPNSPNTDGFDISDSQNIVIQDSNIGTGDDCIAINGDSFHIRATRVNCGPGHGISIGSLGKHNSHEIVEDVRVQHCSFIRTTNGARIKTWPGGSGYARNITFQNIELMEVRNPIIIDQNYGGEHGRERQNLEANAVKVRDVRYINFNGTSYGDKAIDLKCSISGCFNIKLEQINIVSSQQNKPAYASCKNVYEGIIGYTVPKVSCILEG